ncbi:hypothetical protein K491DRAFT_614212 [Lophiostoma macrostomum CBS 122681]|uniref:Mso1 N-terminal domain-containing protein n=1 Tax=Lophiostoma macrostomum CBS 122681 TaxID=1314788 RepID=A0A6A6SMU3_9PLEO|nr:hypothetical protein K491DRAFT_614212 [Lophiostoma macrostomum CBS 122681]
MSGYFSNLLTNTTSRYNNLRRTLLSDEADGDTEDDSHISRVLRTYYTEKGRPYPPWLPPDPKAPQSAPTQFVSSSGRQQSGPQMGRGGGGLSDLWDGPQQPPPQQEPLSLRRAQGRGGGGAAAAGARPLPGRPGMGNSFSPEPQAQGRPLPSQRAGSYQSASSFGGRPDQPSPPPSSGSGTSAQDRLKARLWGSGRSTSPSQSATSSNTTSGGRAPYPEDRNSGYSSGGGRQQNSYGMSANSPWVGSDDPYADTSNYGGSGGQQQQPPPGRGGGRVGLPSGPRMRY